MSQAEFVEQVNRLKNVYGEKSYPDERVKLLWREVSGMGGEWFESAVSQLISNSRYAPLAPEFAPLISDERERVWKLQKDKQAVSPLRVPDCEFCSDRSVYLCTRNGDRSAPYAFRCHCPKGSADKRKNIPQYKQEHADQGFKFYQVSWSAQNLTSENLPVTLK